MAAGAHASDSSPNAFTPISSNEVDPIKGPAFPFYWVSAVDVQSSSNTGTVVALGDSITDGYCSTRTNNGGPSGVVLPDVYNRWTDCSPPVSPPYRRINRRPWSTKESPVIPWSRRH